MSRPEFHDLTQSPLDEPSQSHWWPVVVGGLIGAVAAAAIFVVIGSEDSELDSPETVVSTMSTTTAAGLPAEPSSFPLGYVAVSDTEAFKPHHVVTAEGQIVVTMTTSYARDLDPTTQQWFLGGTWILETTSGESIVSESTLFDDGVPGGFSVVFPVPPDTIGEPEQLRLVERWEPMQSTATVDVNSDRLAGQLGVLLEPLLMPMDGFGLRFDRISIPNIEHGDAYWALEGDPRPRGVVSLAIEMMGPDEQLIATGQPWAETIRPFGLDASQGTAGFAIIPNQPGHLDTAEKAQAFMAELALVERLIIHCTVTTGDPQPVDHAVFDLTVVDQLPLTREG